MKRYAIADEVPEDCDYLTAGKEYEVLDGDKTSAVIVDNNGRPTLIYIEKCAFLNGKSWRIVEREE